MVSRTTMPPPLVDNVLETPLGMFLDKHRVTERGDACSFTGMGLMKGKFMVKDEEYPQFLDLLHEYLFTQQRRPINLVEQRRCDSMTPILIDLDFKYPVERAIQRQFEILHSITLRPNPFASSSLFVPRPTKTRSPNYAPSKTAFISNALIWF